MSNRITRLSGVRQGLAIALLVILAFILYQFIVEAPSDLLVQSIFCAILAVTCLVSSVEDYYRGNRVFSALAIAIGILSISTGIYVYSP
ncbi:hypothetical protein [Dokdonella immobilis]|uniref:hypothetical protein n=1 Tax=Dokdonella immobilis TaxID=578942 RepID=UPI001113B204|nr:hypothetical protein [Dokdonella immobilis]